MEHGRILAYIAVKVHVGAVIREVEQLALDFQRVFVLLQPVEKLENVLLLGVESAVFVAVSARFRSNAAISSRSRRSSNSDPVRVARFFKKYILPPYLKWYGM